jgi:hypothetical protein
MKVTMEFIVASASDAGREAQAALANTVRHHLAGSPMAWSGEAIDQFFNGGLSLGDAHALADMFCAFGRGLENVVIQVHNDDTYLEHDRFSLMRQDYLIPIRISRRLEVTFEGVTYPPGESVMAAPPPPPPIPRETSPQLQRRRQLRSGDI